MTTDIASAMKIVKLEGELRAASAQIGALRQHLAAAICAECSDFIGDEEMALNSRDQLSHQRCVQDED